MCSPSGFVLFYGDWCCASFPATGIHRSWTPAQLSYVFLSTSTVWPWTSLPTATHQRDSVLKVFAFVMDHYLPLGTLLYFIQKHVMGSLLSESKHSSCDRSFNEPPVLRTDTNIIFDSASWTGLRQRTLKSNVCSRRELCAQSVQSHSQRHRSASAFAWRLRKLNK